MATKVKVIKGEDRTLSIQLSDEDTGGYYDLTSATEISVCFKKSDLTTLTKTYTGAGGVTIVSAIAGQIAVALSDTETGTLFVDDAAPIYVMVDVGTARRVVTKGLEMALAVEAKPF